MSFRYDADVNLEHSRLFIKNLITFLIPVLLPVLILGSVSIVITQQYIKDNIDNQNENLLKHIRSQVELIFDEINSLQLSFSRNPEINSRLKSILKSSEISIEDYTIIRSISSFINAQADARPYIHSIYLSFDNSENRFLTTTEGLIADDKYFDMKWQEEYLEKKERLNTWTSYRRLNPEGFNKSAIDVITIYWLLRTNDTGDGVLVMNVYADYLEKLLHQVEAMDEQIILVQDVNGKIILSNKYLSYLDELDMLYTLKTDKKGVIKSSLHSQIFNWDYYSVVPEKIIYRIPIVIRKLLIFLLIIMVISGIIVSYFLTRRNYSRIYAIIDIISQAEQGQHLADEENEIRDEYSYITNKIVKTFIQQSYLKLQLSERKYRQKTLELMALQSQINPHFLYNTLETIYWKVFQFTGYPNEANDMLENLSDILKYSLHHPRERIKIREEIKHTINYLKIQQIRYQDKFEVIWQYPETILEKDIIKLILQPLVENAIYHGIKEKEGRCSIKIKFRIVKGEIKVSIIDNGVGIKKERLNEIKDKLTAVIQDIEQYSIENKIGLYNTSKRLTLLFGQDSRIYIRSKRGKGTVVFFYLPLNV